MWRQILVINIQTNKTQKSFMETKTHPAKDERPMNDTVWPIQVLDTELTKLKMRLLRAARYVSAQQRQRRKNTRFTSALRVEWRERAKQEGRAISEQVRRTHGVRGGSKDQGSQLRANTGALQGKKHDCGKETQFFLTSLSRCDLLKMTGRYILDLK